MIASKANLGDNKMDEVGWNMYFKEIPQVEKPKIKKHKSKVLVNLEEYEGDWHGWRELVNHNLTSSSEVFKLRPEFQLMWQEGYGPEDPLNCDVKAWEDYLDGLPYWKHYDMFINLFYPPIDHDHDDDDDDDDDHKGYDHDLYQTYYKTEGFDVDFSPPPDCCGAIIPMFNDMRPVPAHNYHQLILYSWMAVDYYNREEGTDYTVNRVVKACHQLVAGMLYYITFEAKNSKDHFHVFEAEVYVPGLEPDEVLLVRPKAMRGMPSDTHSLSTPPIIDSHQAAKLWQKYLKQIKESEGFDIDVCSTDGYGRIKPMFNDTCPVSAKIYYMLSKCSRIAVDAYNQREGTDYTVNRVVKVCTQVDCGIMYFITFEAMQCNNHFQVFQAMVYDPIIGENKVLLVRPKAMVKDLFVAPCDSHHDVKCLGKYVEQIKETQGFDIDVRISDGDGTIVPMFYDMSRAKTDDSLINYSRNALAFYNLREGTDYNLYQVLKACAQTVAGRMYYITFEAINSNDHLQVFQATVFHLAKGQNEVLLVRRKA